MYNKSRVITDHPDFFQLEADMPVVVEAIVVSFGMLLIFAIAFFLVFLLAVAMFPIEKSLSKIIWDSQTPKRPLPAPPKGSFKDFSRKH